MHRLVTLVDMAVLDDQTERAHLIGLEARRHGQVGMIPIAEHAQPLEIGALCVHLLVCILPARRTKRLGVDLLSDSAMRFLDLHLDGQAMAIPTRNIGCVIAVQGARLDDDVLENLVYRVAQVDRTIGVRRAVGENEGGPALGGGANLVLKTAAFPRRQHSRLPMGKICLHRKTGVRQIDRVFVVSHYSPSTRTHALGAHRPAFAPSSHPKNRT